MRSRSISGLSFSRVNVPWLVEFQWDMKLFFVASYIGGARQNFLVLAFKSCCDTPILKLRPTVTVIIGNSTQIAWRRRRRFSAAHLPPISLLHGCHLVPMIQVTVTVNVVVSAGQWILVAVGAGAVDRWWWMVIVLQKLHWGGSWARWYEAPLFSSGSRPKGPKARAWNGLNYWQSREQVDRWTWLNVHFGTYNMWIAWMF